MVTYREPYTLYFILSLILFSNFSIKSRILQILKIENPNMLSQTMNTIVITDHTTRWRMGRRSCRGGHHLTGRSRFSPTSVIPWNAIRFSCHQKRSTTSVPTCVWIRIQMNQTSCISLIRVQHWPQWFGNENYRQRVLWWKMSTRLHMLFGNILWQTRLTIIPTLKMQMNKLYKIKAWNIEGYNSNLQLSV